MLLARRIASPYYVIIDSIFSILKRLSIDSSLLKAYSTRFLPFLTINSIEIDFSLNYALYNSR